MSRKPTPSPEEAAVQDELTARELAARAEAAEIGRLKPTVENVNLLRYRGKMAEAARLEKKL